MKISTRNRLRGLLNTLDPGRRLRETIRSAATRVIYRHDNLLATGQGNGWIKECLRSGQPASVAKIGASERKIISAWLGRRGYTGEIAEEIDLHSGVFPNDPSTLDKFAATFTHSCEDIDMLAVWGGASERDIVQKFCRSSVLCSLIDLEPYYFSDPWSGYLRGKKVLVISPFSKSIERQYQNRRRIWDLEKYSVPVLPDFELQVLTMPFSNALVPTGHTSWFDLCENVLKRVYSRDFDVALIGAGAASIPLCHMIKGHGKFAIHLGGATQILFGITGARWDQHPIISKFINESWVRPLPEETPQLSRAIENNAYW